jgi:hypothetical protein
MTVNDVVLRLGDHLGNYSVGQVSTDQKIRAVDSAVNYMKNMIGLPNDEKKYSFYYTADVSYYNTPSDFQEALTLYYDNQNENVIGNQWNYRPYQEILPMIGSWPNQNTWGHTTINGKHQLLLWGTNIIQSQLIESFDVNVWATSGDASGNHIDTTVYQQGGGSNAFNITYSTGKAILTSPAISVDVSTLFKEFGNLNLYVDFASTNVTSVQLILTSTTGNYYTLTATTASGGAAFLANNWNQLVFPTSAAVATGNPLASSISSVQIVFNIPSNFGSVTNMRVDNFYMSFPDLLDFIYLSNAKGVDANGNSKSVLTALSDVLSYDWDFIEPISLQAALYSWPQLRGDPNFMQIYQQTQNATLKTWGRRYPKKRLANDFMRTQLRR